MEAGSTEGIRASLIMIDSDSHPPSAPFESAGLLIRIPDVDTCDRFARTLVDACEYPLTIALNGTLGAGKTQLAKSIVAALGGDVNDVTSPTYVIVHDYPTTPHVYHLDLYRIADEDELLEIGFEEILESAGLILIEWAERFQDSLPDDRLEISIRQTEGSHREFLIHGLGASGRRLLGALREQFTSQDGARP